MEIPVRRSVLSLKQFLLSQYFSDGLKITFGVVLPSIICYQFDQLEVGVVLSMGALFVSITDNPGPLVHKRNAMLTANLCIFVVALLIGFINRNGVLLALAIPACCFFFSMFTVYGARASSVGISALLVLVVSIDRRLEPLETLLHAVFLLAGGLWYTGFSLLFQNVLPYRPAEQTLGQCILEISDYLKIKAAFYHKDTDLLGNHTKLINQQILVYQEQENLRDILFRTRRLLKDSSAQGNKLIMTFIDLVDLYEQTMESYQDYERLHLDYDRTGILESYRKAILKLSDDLAYIGTCIHNHESPQRFPDYEPLIADIRGQLDRLREEGIQTVVLMKILVNLKNISARIQQIYTYQEEQPKVPDIRRKELRRFISRQALDWQLFRENMSFRSSVFRHSLRVAIVCFVAFIFARNFYTGHFSYWILLTILVILKPAFSQTKKRNYERMIGTVAGGMLGIGILHLFHETTTLFWLLLLFMLLAYSLIRVRYIVSVVFMTPYILIMFHFVGHTADNLLIVRERILDTFIGAGIAAIASYFLFPTWESGQLRKMMNDMLLRNLTYLQSVLQYRTDDYPSQVAYRIARKEMYVSTSNLASAFQRMLNEPKRKRQYVNEANKFMLLNNVLASQVAALAYAVRQDESLSELQQREIRKSFHLLKESIDSFSIKKADIPELKIETRNGPVMQHDEICTQMVQVAGELKKLTSAMAASRTEKVYQTADLADSTASR